ncbi:MAG: hypothetical protein H6891_04545 [Brucellaceae bacterium]|nr:hypothetical protein [Brucellaceae bacterium]
MSGASRRAVVQRDGMTVVLIDSITQVEPGDAGRIVISGSHGGISAASFAAKVKAALYVFNDAGIGKDRAGIAGLDMLEAVGIAAVAVAHDSARIGDARDTLENGVVSAVNARAASSGAIVGMTVPVLVSLLAKC